MKNTGFISFVLISLSLVGCSPKVDAPSQDASLEDVLPEQEVQLVGDIEVLVDTPKPETEKEVPKQKTPPPSTNTTDTQEVEPIEEQESDVDLLSEDEMRDLDAEMEAFLDEILSGIE